MSSRQDKAVELKNRTGDAHYNCAQAVACVFADEGMFRLRYGDDGGDMWSVMRCTDDSGIDEV